MEPVVTPDQFKKLQEDVTEIKTAILGIPNMEVKGIATKVKEHSEYIDTAKKRHTWLVGASGGAGFGFALVWEWIKHKLGL